MADAYLDSTGAGTAASPYDVYGTNEAKSISAFDAETFLSAGDTVWVASAHRETAGITYTGGTNSTAQQPTKFIAVTNIGTNTSLVTTPSAGWVTAVNATLNFEGECYFYGWQIRTSWGASPAIFLASSANGPHKQVFDTCRLENANGNGTLIRIGPTAQSTNDESIVILKNSHIQFNRDNQSVQIANTEVVFENITLGFGGGTNVVGTAANTLFVTLAGSSSIVRLDNSDLTGNSFLTLFDPVASSIFEFTGRNLKLPSSCTTYCDTILGPGNTFKLDDFTVGSTYVPFYRRYYSGQVTYDSAIKANSTSDRMYITNDQSDGGYSIKMAGDSTNCTFWEPLYSDWIHVEVEDTSTAITPYAEILVSGDGATALTDRQAWIEVDAMTGTSRLATRQSDAPSIIAGATNQSSGTVAFTGHGYSSPTTHKLALPSAITPGVKGYIRMRVALATNATVYVGKIGYA